MFGHKTQMVQIFLFRSPKYLTAQKMSLDSGQSSQKLFRRKMYGENASLVLEITPINVLFEFLEEEIQSLSFRYKSSSPVVQIKTSLFRLQMINNRMVYFNMLHYDPPKPKGPIRRTAPFSVPVACSFNRSD